jgi:hypothetical protein
VTSFQAYREHLLGILLELAPRAAEGPADDGKAAPAERQIARWIVRAMRNTPAVSFANRDNSLGLLKAMLRRCDLLVTNDTGARHLAAAAGISVVTIFGRASNRGRMKRKPAISGIGLIVHGRASSDCAGSMMMFPLGSRFFQYWS